jgi:membrane protein YdbS with pleckstrin-like domain
VFETTRRALLQLLRVPAEPHPPEGSPGSVLVFRAGRNFYRWRVMVWAWSNLVALVLAFVSYVSISAAMRKVPPWAIQLLNVVELAGLISLLAGVWITYLALRLNYELRWYMVTDRSLRIRRGIWSVEELTMTFANIQEIRVAAGPLQNWLGLADVEVHAAGGGSVNAHGQPTGGHKAVFEGVDNANEIRDLLVERLRVYRDSGLGEATVSTAPAADALSAARLVLEETRALRLLVSAD